MTSYKLVASDLDGTLLDKSGNISRKNLAAIDALLDLGVHFVPCSGRTLSELPRELIDNKNIRYIIHSNGATVLDRNTGDKILNCIPNRLSQKILNAVNSYKTHVTYRMNGECFVDARFQSLRDWEYYNVSNAHRTVVRDFSVYLEDFKEKSFAADNVEVIVAFFHDLSEKLACIKELEKEPLLQVVELAENNIEVMSKTAGKGNALVSLAKMLGTDISKTMSLGDSGNDISMTCASGLGLAMSNAEEALKKAADSVICSNEEHAIAYILEHYFQ